MAAVAVSGLVLCAATGVSAIETTPSQDEIRAALDRGVEAAKAHLLERSEDLIRHELARTARQLEEEARGEARRRARNLVADALQRVAASADGGETRRD